MLDSRVAGGVGQLQQPATECSPAPLSCPSIPHPPFLPLLSSPSRLPLAHPSSISFFPPPDRRVSFAAGKKSALLRS
jgi:hypothetical protein